MLSVYTSSVGPSWERIGVPQLTRGADFTALIAACRRQSSWRQAIGFLQQISDSSLGEG